MVEIKIKAVKGNLLWCRYEIVCCELIEESFDVILSIVRDYFSSGIL